MPRPCYVADRTDNGGSIRASRRGSPRAHRARCARAPNEDGESEELIRLAPVTARVRGPWSPPRLPVAPARSDTCWSPARRGWISYPSGSTGGRGRMAASDGIKNVGVLILEEHSVHSQFGKLFPQNR